LDHSRSLLAGAKFSRANVSRLFKGLKSYIYSSAFYVGIWAIYLVFLINALIDSSRKHRLCGGVLELVSVVQAALDLLPLLKKLPVASDR